MLAVKDDLFGLRMSDPRLKSLSTVAEDPTAEESCTSLKGSARRFGGAQGDMVGRDRGGVSHPDFVPNFIDLLYVLLERRIEFWYHIWFKNFLNA